MNDLISIIIPVFNVQAYLSNCLDSVLEQTYKNLEIILVDDGSQDDCGSICDLYAKKDARIKVIHQENQGLSAARNRGMDVMTGDYFAFIDSDDILDPDFIRILYDILTANKTEISMCSLANFSDENAPNTSDISGDCEIRVMSENEYANELLGDYTTPYSVVWNKLYRTDKFGKLRFHIDKRFEDSLFLADYLMIGATCAKTNQILYHYRIRNTSLSYRKDIHYIIGSINANRYQYDILKDRYGKEFRSTFYQGLLKRISRLAADVYWNLNKDEAKKIRLIWMQFYNSDRQSIPNKKENVKIHLYKYFPTLYYHLVKKSIYSIINVS